MLFFPKKFSVLQIRFFGNFASYKKSHHCVTFQKVIFFFWFVTQWFVCVCTQWFGTQKGIIVLQTCPAVSHIWSRTAFPPTDTTFAPNSTPTVCCFYFFFTLSFFLIFICFFVFIFHKFVCATYKFVQC